MVKGGDFKVLKIQTYILKVNMHCDGCKEKVKKLLRKIEGVCSVSIDVEHQRVTVTGNVDSGTLIKKLARSGKRAEIWSQKTSSQNPKTNQQKQQKQAAAAAAAAHPMKDGQKNNKDEGKQGLIQGLQAFKNQHNKLSSLSSDEEDYYDDDDDDDEDDGLDELPFLNMNQINFLRQASNAAANAKKTGHGNPMGNGNSGAGNKGGGNPNQNQMKNPNGSQQKGIDVPGHSKIVNGVHLGGGNPHAGEGRRVNDINGMMMGLHGLGANKGGGFQGNGFPGYTRFPSNGEGNGGHHQSPMMVNMQGYQAHPSSIMNNLRGHNNNMMMHPSTYMQPQMMYHRSPQIPPYTGYYHHLYPNPYHPNNQSENDDYGVHLFSDENTKGCIVM
ncbi:heavy metal-associated isoprenylated plant protein 37-like [Phoenix dactylifera]|uniref:Heavy metal-associated isoprenylated plant protein 37-like n=1 Tax=Phoenix dactylifera TaxID=42345 RepID=A0A8B7CTL7_PHODC|nr:heavy metal-associated isoprenylated plant protein 37-like [Phoenix dactylifera]